MGNSISGRGLRVQTTQFVQFVLNYIRHDMKICNDRCRAYSLLRTTENIQEA